MVALSEQGTLGSGYLDKLRQIDIFLYEWKDSHKHDVGIIAQKLEKLFQDDVLNGRVIEMRNGNYYVRFNSLQTIVIKALQELADKVDESNVTLRTVVQSEIQKWERERNSVANTWSDVPVAYQVVNFLIVVGNSIGLYKYFSCTACGCHAKHTQIKFGFWKCTSKKCPCKGRGGACVVHPSFISFITPKEHSRKEISRRPGVAPSFLFVLLFCFLRYRKFL